MSVYTTEVRYICEYESGLTKSVGFNDIDSVIEKSWDKIFTKFPIFDEGYRKPLCIKILQHYYTREICAETVGLWKFWLNQRMRDIMPYYNKLYETEQLKFDPLHEVDFTRTITENNTDIKSGNSNTSSSNSDSSESTSSQTNSGTADSTQTGNATTTSTENKNSKNLHSDTPQGSIQNITDNGYLTDATISTTESTNTVASDTSNTTKNTAKSEGNFSTSNISNTSTNTGNNYSENNKGEKTYIEHLSGKNSSASYAKLISEYRDSLLNIDLDIILELRDLFMNIY